MKQYLRVVMACVGQVCQRSGSAGANLVVGMLPGSTSTMSTGGTDEVALTAGMTAGIVFTAWELGEADDSAPLEHNYPGDMINSSVNSPFLSVQSTGSPAKVKYVQRMHLRWSSSFECSQGGWWRR